MKNIKIVSSDELKEIIQERTPFGLFLANDGHNWSAVDNSTGDAWTESFYNKWEAIRWLLRLLLFLADRG